MVFQKRSRMVVLCAIVAASALLFGCASWGDDTDDATAQQDDPERARYANLSTDGLQVDKADLSGNDEPDQWKYHDGDGNLVRVERDMNFDGDVNIWEYYENGELVEEEMAIDRGGEIDVVMFYEEGRVVRQLMASEFDGRFPIEKFYDSEERLLRVERDTSGDGQVDTWEYFEDGERDRIGWDTSGDGQPDTFDHY